MPDKLSRVTRPEPDYRENRLDIDRIQREHESRITWRIFTVGVLLVAGTIYDGIIAQRETREMLKKGIIPATDHFDFKLGYITISAFVLAGFLVCDEMRRYWTDPFYQNQEARALLQDKTATDLLDKTSGN